MASRVQSQTPGPAPSLVERLVADDGSAGHDWPARLVAGRAAPRDLADAVHALCTLYGQYPGLADDARERGVQAEAGDWLTASADAFAAERAVLATLAAAVGPLPSTPGHAESEAAILTQRHALEMLARSDRRGCASGAVAALVLDWRAVRDVLNRAATVFGTDIAPNPMPDETATGAALAAFAVDPACERALAFGAQQLLAQHRALWSLLEARAEARG